MWGIERGLSSGKPSKVSKAEGDRMLWYWGKISLVEGCTVDLCCSYVKGCIWRKAVFISGQSWCGHAPGRAAMAGEKCECQRISHGRELHNQLAVGVKKRKESSKAGSLISDLEVNGHLKEGFVCSNTSLSPGTRFKDTSTDTAIGKT